jgi:ubiquinone biosynthesis protein Coq4
VAKSGADFDVDKLTTFMPAINEKGQFIESGMTNEALKNKVEELNKTEEGRKVAERMIKVQKAALENRLITSIKGILELPDNYANLVKPNDTYLLKDDIADKIQDDVIDYNRFDNVHDGLRLGKKKQKVISPTRILEIPYNLHKHDVNMIGKKVLGMIAVENSLHPIFNSIGAHLPKTYKASVFNRNENKYEDIDKDYSVRLFLPHNKTENGEVSLAGTDTVDGMDNIAELYSQMMNGAVDVEKDAWIFFIQGNYEVTPMITFLLKAGVPKEQAVLFVSNPFVREYAKQQRLIKSAYAKLTGTIPQDFKTAMGKYKAAELAMRKFGIREKANKLISNDSYYDAVNDKVVRSGVLNFDSNFKLEKMKEIVKDPKLNDDYLRDYAFAMFLHYIELEKMSKGFTTLKMQSNPDTKTSKTLQEIIRRNLSLEDIKEISKLPKGMVDAMQESILGSFFDNKLISDLVIPVFPLRNSQEVTDFIIKKTKTNSVEISTKFGPGQDGIRQFITKFKNAIPNYIYQNYMSNMLDESGKITSMPSVYKKMTVKEKAGITKGAEIVGNIIYVDKTQLEKDFANDLYTRDNNAPDSYKNRGLVGFNASDNIFPNESQYAKYVIEREYQRSLYPLAEQANNKDYLKFLSLTQKYEKDPAKAKEIAYERFLNQRALINAFNRKAIMELPNGTYTDMVLEMIDEFKHLKVKYPILAQLSKPNLKTGQSVLTLNDLKDLKDSQLAEIYYQNIKDLGDETVHKVIDTSDNARISKLFQLLPVMMIYQHGLGYSKYGFNDALPYEDYIGVMQTASDIFMANDMSNNTLNTVYYRLVDAVGIFPNYVISPFVYKSGSLDQPAEELSVPADNERILDLLSRAEQIEEEVPTTQPSTSVEADVNNDYTFNSAGVLEYKNKELDDLFLKLRDEYKIPSIPKTKEETRLFRLKNALLLTKNADTNDYIKIPDLSDIFTNTEALNLYKQYLNNINNSRDLFIERFKNDSLFNQEIEFRPGEIKKGYEFIPKTTKALIEQPSLLFLELFKNAGLKPGTDAHRAKLLDLKQFIDSKTTVLLNNAIKLELGIATTQPTVEPEMKRDTPIQPEVSDQIQPEGLPGIPRTSSSCK